MAKKLTPKQLKFRDLYLELGNATEAYRRAYSCGKMKERTIQQKAHELLKHGDIAASLSDIQAKASEIVVKKHAITLDLITQMLMEDRLTARKLEDSAAATAQCINAAMSLAKLHGLIIDKVVTDNATYVMGIDKPMDEDEFDSKFLRVGMEGASRTSDRTRTLPIP